MSADAIARLREAVDSDIDTAVNDEDAVVHRDDLRALLDRAALLDEALDAVQCAVDEFGWDDPAEEAHECIRPMLSVLAKAGRR